MLVTSPSLHSFHSLIFLPVCLDQKKENARQGYASLRGVTGVLKTPYS